jgi:hydroxysqualene dehydroxylase
VSRPNRVHIVGAGLAGLAAALRLAEAGVALTLHEAAPQAGGRCRSYLDATLGCRIDNGNHMLISGNHAALAYLRAVGAAATLDGPGCPRYAFVDLATGERWVVRPNSGRLPWWLMAGSRRVAGTGVIDYFRALRLLTAGPEATVSGVFDPASVVFRRLWQPLAVAALNTEAETAAAALLARVLGESFGAGGAACIPLVPRHGLSESFVDPALAHLAAIGAEVKLGSRLRMIDFAEGRVRSLGFEGGEATVAPDEAVILAVPAPVAARLVPELTVPEAFRAIVNAHYRVVAPPSSPFFVGLIGGHAQWVYRKAEVLSVTISAAERYVDMPAEELAPLLWRDVLRAYQLADEALPRWQIVKERRATFAATPAQLARRPGAATRWVNLALAGDWTDTGLPATIEGAVRSGRTAAEQLLRH